MAVSTNHIRRSVRTAPDVCSPHLLRVALQAVIKDLLGLHLGERDDLGLVSLGLNVSFAWTVTTLATLLLKLQLLVSSRLEVSVAKESS